MFLTREVVANMQEAINRGEPCPAVNCKGVWTPMGANGARQLIHSRHCLYRRSLDIYDERDKRAEAREERFS